MKKWKATYRVKGEDADSTTVVEVRINAPTAEVARRKLETQYGSESMVMGPVEIRD